MRAVAFAELQLVHARLRAVEQAQAVLPLLDVVIGPDLAVDQDLVAGLYSPLVADTLQGDQSGSRDRRSLFEAEVGRCELQLPFGNCHEFGVGPGILPLVALDDLAEHPVAGLEAGGVLADALDGPGDIYPRDPDLRLA